MALDKNIDALCWRPLCTGTYHVIQFTRQVACCISVWLRSQLTILLSSKASNTADNTAIARFKAKFISLRLSVVEEEQATTSLIPLFCYWVSFAPDLIKVGSPRNQWRKTKYYYIFISFIKIFLYFIYLWFYLI